jgi:Uma2 family endonuclease
MIRAACVPEHTVGADQFVYFDAANPKRCLAPDAFVTLGVRDHDFDAYLVWEEGTPDVAFEVLSPSDTPERWTFEEKLRRYRALGVRELLVGPVDEYPVGLRLARDSSGTDLVLTDKEGRLSAETAASDARSAAERAEARVAELEGKRRDRS